MDSLKAHEKGINCTCQISILCNALYLKWRRSCSHCFVPLCVSIVSPLFWPLALTLARHTHHSTSSFLRKPGPLHWCLHPNNLPHLPGSKEEKEKGKCVCGRIREAGDSGVLKQHQLFSGFGCVSEVFWIIIWMYVRLSFLPMLKNLWTFRSSPLWSGF